MMHNPLIPDLPVRSPLVRHAGNPVLTKEHVPYPATIVYNPGVARWGDRYVMLFRNDYGQWGDPSFDGTNMGLARSADGVRWEVAPEPCITVEKAQRILEPYFPHGGREETIAVYDPRITVLDGRAYIGFGMSTRHGRRGGLMVTDDFDRFEPLCLVAPDNRDVVLFPETIGGRYVRFERPMNSTGKAESHPGMYGIYVSTSPDLRDWSTPIRVLASDDVPFSNGRVGAGAPPIRTDAGWLCLFHTVHADDSRGKHGWEEKWPHRYDGAAMLLDLDDPTKLRALARVPVLSPEAGYENAGGDTFLTDGYRGGVVFPTAAVVDDGGEVKVYYGAADSFVALATAQLNDLVRFVLDAA